MNRVTSFNSTGDTTRPYSTQGRGVTVSSSYPQPPPAAAPLSPHCTGEAHAPAASFPAGTARAHSHRPPLEAPAAPPTPRRHLHTQQATAELPAVSPLSAGGAAYRSRVAQQRQQQQQQQQQEWRRLQRTRGAAAPAAWLSAPASWTGTWAPTAATACVAAPAVEAPTSWHAAQPARLLRLLGCATPPPPSSSCQGGETCEHGIVYTCRRRP